MGRGKSKHRPRNDASLYGGDYPFIQTGEVKEASSVIYITSYSQTYNEKGLAQSKLWEPKTLLITIAANIAETAILTFPACFPDSIIGFVADSGQVSPEFIKYSIEQLKLKMQNVSKGTTQDNLSQEKLRIFDFLVPDQVTVQAFIKATKPIFRQTQNLLQKNYNLNKTRDLLLPKLISGEIDVESLEIESEGKAIVVEEVSEVREAIAV
ncbi:MULTISPECIES: restriction endonuclease subunit S [Trichocoleus]|uniref:Restriction endonuclease subunit S n=1 Tax=Trichocoleus desertorum GB2-A4 TaxID=2933944 RepID=A0ABV0JFF1_9CYAN|nr:restriction endonuclease subunit S [Trichocoleus sp. FACHB-46]